MQRIKIYEKDSTTNQISISEDIGSVFIPGFSVCNSATAASVGIPYECRTVSEFTSLFGTQAPTFKSVQRYPYQEFPTVATTVANLQSLISVTQTSSEGYAVDYIPNKTGGYDVGEYCLYTTGGTTEEPTVVWNLFKANKKIQTPPETFNRADWEIQLTNGDLIQVTSDSEHDNTTTYHYYKIEAIAGSTTTHKGKTEFYKRMDSIEGFPLRAIPYTESPSDSVMYGADTEDPSWNMAYTLLSLGLPVTYVRMNKYTTKADANYDVTVARAYACLASDSDTDTSSAAIGIFRLTESQPILDKGRFNVQFITSGGYPVLEYSKQISSKMINLCKMESADENVLTGRGDCVAILDHTNNPGRALIGPESVYQNHGIISSHAAIFTPWCTTNLSKLTNVPASFIYLYNVASKRSSSSTWSIYAGASNGRSSIVKSLNTDSVLTNKIAELYQNGFTSSTVPGSINAITYVRNYGYCIWGNRVCEHYAATDPGFSLSFLNIRNLVSEVKKTVYSAAQGLMFEINNDVLWTKFKSIVSKKLDIIVAGYGLESYKYARETSPDKTKLKASIILYPTYGLESVEIYIDLQDNNEITITTSNNSES